MSPGPAEDLDRLAVAAYLVGHDDESARAWEQAHARWVEAGGAILAGQPLDVPIF